MTDPADRADSSDSRQNDDPALSTDAKDPTDPIDSAEPTEPMDRTDPRDPIDRKESCDHSDHLDEGFIGAILHTGGSPAHAGSSAHRGHSRGCREVLQHHLVMTQHRVVGRLGVGRGDRVVDRPVKIE